MRIIAAFLLLLLVAGIAYAELPAGLEISKRPLTLEERLLIEDMKANNRWIVPKSTGIARIVLEGAGCKISKNLNGPYEAYAVKCPNNVHISGAIRDEILTVKGISEAVKINADDVWNLGYQGTGQTVAVLDTGIDTTHSQLSNDITGGKNFLASPPSNFFKDDEGHGTNVAGIITSDGTSPFSDSKGIAPRAKLWVAKVCNSLGQCFTSDVVEAIEYIVKGPDGTVNSGDEPARIISMSIGVNEEQVPYWATCDVVQVSQWVNWAVSNGFVVVAAADHNGYGSGINAPACASRAIAVGAVDSADRRYSARSGTGNELDIMAPGVSVVTTSMGGTTETFDGTSAATPHVSAVIALLHQFEPALKDPHNIGMVKDALYKSAKDLGTTGWDSLHGWGRVDALAAIRKLHDPAVTAFSGPARTEKQVTVFLSGTFVNEGVFPEMFSITIKDLTDN
ncbi:MAG: S8 family serine peptidase, partial [Candidatus Aenigmarchaeota archaeon]|nr:S8 family serine peptidase [Candidatus Aenigmarchaeota archaeon]